MMTHGGPSLQPLEPPILRRLAEHSVLKWVLRIPAFCGYQPRQIQRPANHIMVMVQCWFIATEEVVLLSPRTDIALDRSRHRIVFINNNFVKPLKSALCNLIGDFWIGIIAMMRSRPTREVVIRVHPKQIYTRWIDQQNNIGKKSKNMKVEITGKLSPGVTAKDITLAVIGETGTAGGTGYVIEYCGEAIRSLSMEGRMTVCNMAIEGGARAGLIAPDETTFEYCKGRPNAPSGETWEAALAYWKTLYTDDDAHFDKVLTLKGEDIAPVVTWGTSPEDVLPITASVPSAQDFSGGKVEAAQRSLDYMGLTAGTPLCDIEIDTVFIGSCTNGRIEDLRAAAKILKGRKIKEGMRAMIVPGSGLVRAQAEEEGLADIFKEAGFEWRLAGCSMCLAMNPDQLQPGERCAATSNRNFEGRQGRGGRTHLMSPAMAAAAALTGKLTDVREML